MFFAVRLTVFRHKIMRRICKENYSLYITSRKRSIKQIERGLISCKIIITFIGKDFVISVKIVCDKKTFRAPQWIIVIIHFDSACADVVSKSIERQSTVAVKHLHSGIFENDVFLRPQVLINPRRRRAKALHSLKAL